MNWKTHYKDAYSAQLPCKISGLPSVEEDVEQQNHSLLKEV